MGLAQFERRLERLVEGAFAKTYRRGLQPVELGRRLTREMHLQRTAGVRGLIAPNVFVVVLSSADAERFSGFADALARELADVARQQAHDEGYSFVGPLEVSLEEDPELRTGTFEIRAEVIQGPGGTLPAGVLLPDGRRVDIGERPVTIGRLPGCDILLDDPNVSRRHAELRREDGYVLLSDLGSTNGTAVNGRPAQTHHLVDGDRITVGQTTLAFEEG